MIDVQVQDPTITKVVEYANCGKIPNLRKQQKESEEVYQLMKQWTPLFVDRKGVLCRRSGNNVQAVLPKILREQVIIELHNHLGHIGPERVSDLTRERFFWPNMAKATENYIHHKC